MDPNQANLLGLMVAAMVLFEFLMPGFLLQIIPGQKWIVELGSSILVHGIIYVGIIASVFIFVALIGIVAAMTIIGSIPFPFILVITIVMIHCWRTRNASPPNSPAGPTAGVDVPHEVDDNSTNSLMVSMELLLSRVAREKTAQFSAQELEEITHNFSEVLGSGGLGVVYKGEFRDGVEVAVKVLKDDTSAGAEKQFMAEVDTLVRTHHINLVRLYGFCFEPTKKALVYEYMEKGSLNKFLFGDQEESLAWSELHKIAIGIAKGIAYLHEECQQRIIHYDLKPENVLLDANLNPKVADFGVAKLCNRENTHISISGFRGTYGYTAPLLSLDLNI